ncbi:MAG TPA: hypothetical protein VKZ41_07035 [Gemmatimonadales bacterium]|nr:hypothetical protein [Gemmatimonadales bacterium]
MPHLRANVIGSGILVPMSCLLLGACSDPPARSDTEFDYDVPTRVAQLVPPDSLLTVQRRIGEADGELAFPYFTALAANDSLLAVVEAPECRVLLIRRATARLDRTAGRCGQGPGEFQEVGPVAFHRDSIVAIEQGVATALVLGPDGEEVRRVSITIDSVRRYIVRGIESLDVIDDSTWMVSLRLLSSTNFSVDDTTNHSFVATVDSRTGIMRHRFGLDVTKSRRWPERAGRNYPACAAGGARRRIVLANRWAPDAIVFDVEGRPIERVVVHHDRFRNLPDSIGGPFAPLQTSVACSEHAFVISYMLPGATSMSQTRSLIVIAPWDGAAGAAATFVTDEHPMYLGSIDTGVDSTLYFTANQRFEYPLIHEVAFRIPEVP